MNLEKIFDIRFSVPAVITLLLILLLSPEYQRKITENNEPVLTIVVSVLVVLALGFIISSIGKFIHNIYETCCSKKDSKRELSRWLFLHKQGEYVGTKVEARWNMIMANYNCVIAVILSWLFVCVRMFFTQKQEWPNADTVQILIMVSIVGVLIFFTNGLFAYRTLEQMHDQIEEDERGRHK